MILGPGRAIKSGKAGLPTFCKGLSGAERVVFCREVWVEGCPEFEHGAGDREQAIRNGVECSAVSMAVGAEGSVFGPALRMPHGGASQMIDGIAQRDMYKAPKFKNPVWGDILRNFEKSRIAMREQLADAIAETVAFDAQILNDARQFPQFDDDRVEQREETKAAPIRARRFGVTAVVLAAGGREAVAEAIKLLRIDSVYLELAPVLALISVDSPRGVHRPPAEAQAPSVQGTGGAPGGSAQFQRVAQPDLMRRGAHRSASRSAR